MDTDDKTDQLIMPAAEMPTEPHQAVLLPNCVPTNSKDCVYHRGLTWIPIFCANCGKKGVYIPEETRDFAFYLCNPCAENWDELAGTMMVPDNVFWEKVKQTQLEKYGRELSGEEVAEALKDDNHILTKLAKDRYDWKKKKKK